MARVRGYRHTKVINVDSQSESTWVGISGISLSQSRLLIMLQFIRLNCKFCKLVSQFSFTSLLLNIVKAYEPEDSYGSWQMILA